MIQPTVDVVPQALRDLALRLADELEQEYTANAEIGRNRLVCQQRLSEQLEQSRRLYAERILQSESALEGPMAANFLAGPAPHRDRTGPPRHELRMRFGGSRRVMRLTHFGGVTPLNHL
jgi:hypothetical protein